MTSNRQRASVLTETLQALVAGDQPTLSRHLTEDVQVWTPEVSTSTRDEFLGVLDARDGVFSDPILQLIVHDVGGDYACAEWTLDMHHTGPIRLGDGTTIAASGTQLELHGVTVAEFVHDRICSIRQYWNERTLLDQLDPAN